MKLSHLLYSLTALPAFVIASPTRGAAVPAGHATESAAKSYYDIPAGPAEASLKLFSRQSRRPLIAATDNLKDIRTAAVKGSLTAMQALQRMLDGTGLVASEDRRTGAFAIRKDPPTADSKDRPALLPP